MPHFNVWIRNPYPFRFEETQAIEEAFHSTYGAKAVYFKEWPVHFLDIEHVTLTTAKQIANTLKFAHRQAIISDQKYGRAMPEPRGVEVEVRGSGDGRPEWAKVAG